MLAVAAGGMIVSAFADETIACVADPVSGVYCGTGYKISVSVLKPTSGATIWLSETGYADATGSANVTVTSGTKLDFAYDGAPTANAMIAAPPRGIASPSMMIVVGYISK